ncbi:hypothetical protein ABZ816_19250 [Actinosynnema sp. NPDC047251]|uniref:Uncharacterized protein n=1 Tax=Saccharothrix espanaensis (strain ATCC 51144 / DSM 44229 / JCM 9112 / NBRC 15066 / NRRL 15764) TaxID=1179773 RepID=K0K9B3_SACES|nr:hypothetical protein [Saccharothrix espanaensis]CCH33203.1 hypothetical protein BN6_59475 [Saccharothrix espanaensis DSM 44229]
MTKTRLFGEGVLVALAVGALVLLATMFKSEEYQARVGLLAGPASAEAPQYGEVTALVMPALVELARSPSVVGAVGTNAERVSVELVPASGLARLSVRASTAERAKREATALADLVIKANLLAPAGKLRVLDVPEVVRVSPDWPLSIGLALAAGVAAGIATMVVRHLRRTRATDGVRAALASAGVRNSVPVLPDDDPELLEKLTALLMATARPARVIATDPQLVERSEDISDDLPDKVFEPAEGTALIAVAPRGRQQDALAGVVGALPAGTSVVAVVLV